MKSIVIIVSSLLLICNACDKKDKYYPYESWSMEILNNSEHNVNIVFKSNIQSILDIDTNLLINKSFILSTGDNDPVGGGLDLITRGVFDSSIVSFDASKKLIYWHNQNNGGYNDSINNILIKENYISIDKENNHTNYRYTITNADYLRAE